MHRKRYPVTAHLDNERRQRFMQLTSELKLNASQVVLMAIDELLERESYEAGNSAAPSRDLLHRRAGRLPASPNTR